MHRQRMEDRTGRRTPGCIAVVVAAGTDRCLPDEEGMRQAAQVVGSLGLVEGKEAVLRT